MSKAKCSTLAAFKTCQSFLLENQPDLQCFNLSRNAPSAVLLSTKSHLHLHMYQKLWQLSYLPCPRHHRRLSAGRRPEDSDRDWARWIWRWRPGSLPRSCGHLSADNKWDLRRDPRNQKKKTCWREALPQASLLKVPVCNVPVKSLSTWMTHYAPCMEYLHTFALKIAQM